MSNLIDRRRFLGKTATLGGAVFATYHANSFAAADSNSSLERLNVAAVGVAGRAGANLHEVGKSQNIVAIADIDQNRLDEAGKKYTQARKYRDFRVMLEKEEKRVDAVLVGCADHTHAPAAAMALRMKKHVYCEKPLTHTVYESRVLSDLARENQLVTQMGTQIHAQNNYRRVVELVQTGAIGEIREVHVWVNVNYSGSSLITGNSAPPHVDWNLWLGPASARPYCESMQSNGEIVGVHPFNWRRHWDFGTGGLGDFGCHYIDLPHWALDLKHPTKISATGPKPYLENTTAGLEVTYEYPARGDLPPVKLIWYDGGRKPEILANLKDEQGQPLQWNNGQLFVGSDGMIISNYSAHRLLPVDRFADFKRPDPFIPQSLGHHNEWIDAIKNSGPTTCNFDYSGALTEMVLLGVVSYRSGETIEWDAAKLKVTNAPRVQQFLHKEYRKGWTL